MNAICHFDEGRESIGIYQHEREKGEEFWTSKKRIDTSNPLELGRAARKG